MERYRRGEREDPPVIPRGYEEHILMEKFGWSYQQLMATPEEIVARELRWLSTENKFYMKRDRSG